MIVKIITERYGQQGSTLNKYEMCDALEMSRATYYRMTRIELHPAEKKKQFSPRKLTVDEEEKVLLVLNSPRFCDMAPGEIYATLLDESIYLCSQRTMYRILESNKQNIQRRQKQPGSYARPELLATGPNQLWSWDITKLKGPKKWTYYYLYKIMDVYSRVVVGWMVAYRESAELAGTLINETCRRQAIKTDQLTLHADRGSSMKSVTVAQLLADLGVTKTHSRPHVSNDNPYSESLFKTLKYRPDFPECFGCIEDSRSFCRDFFNWYNKEHKHSGIAWLTPDDLHYGRADEIVLKRQMVMDDVYKKNPERFVKGPSIVKKPDNQVWINKPTVPVDLFQNNAA
jgi:putative transposase